jgi:hypothetical protein
MELDCDAWGIAIHVARTTIVLEGAIPVRGGVTHTAPRKYHNEIIPLAFIHTKYGEPIVVMVFRRAIQKVLCLTPLDDSRA